MGERRPTADGRILEKQADGTIVEVGRQPAAPVTYGTPNPYQLPKAAADVGNTTTNTRGKALGNQFDEATMDARVRREEAEAKKAEAEAANAAAGAGGADLATKKFSQVQAARQLHAQLDRVEELYDTNFRNNGLLSPFEGIGPKGTQFDAASNMLMPSVKPLARVPGEGATDRSEYKDYRDLLPRANSMDATNDERVMGLREMANSILRQNGLPEYSRPEKTTNPLIGGMEEGTIQSLPTGPIDGGINGMGMRAAPIEPASGALRGPETRKEYDWDAQGRYEAMLRGGASLEEMNAAAQADGYDPFNANEYNKARAHLKKYPREKSNIVSPPLKSVKQTSWERNVQGAPGATALGFANAGSMGALELLAPEGVAMGRSAHPIASMVGEIGGVIGNHRAVMRLTPMGRISNPVARNMAYDTGYAATRGAAANPENPLGGAIMSAPYGMVGSVAGQGFASGVGRAATGVSSSPIISRLRAASPSRSLEDLIRGRGVPDQGFTPTVGQIMRGRAVDSGGRSVVAGMEDAVANTPGAGAFVQGARQNALEQANNAGYRIAAEGAPITGVGREAVDQVGAARSAAYNDAFDGVSLSVREPRFAQQMDSIHPGRGADEFGNFIDNTLRPSIGGSPTISGQRLQELLRMLQTNRKSYRTAATMNPAMGDVAGAVGKVEDALVGNAARNFPDAIPKLKKANRLNRNFNIMDDASGSAVNERGVWTGAQLGQAIGRDAQAYSGGRGITRRARSGLHQFQQDIQAVLPNKVPPTGVNTVPVAGLLAGVGAGGYGAGEATDSPMLKSLALLTLLASPYTKAGSKLMAKTLLDRPAAVREFGGNLRKAKGLFGSAAVPVTLEEKRRQDR